MTVTLSVTRLFEKKVAQGLLRKKQVLFTAFDTFKVGKSLLSITIEECWLFEKVAQKVAIFLGYFFG